MDEKTLSVYASKAHTYVGLVSRGKPDQDLQSFIDAVPAGGLVLDLGCGPGNSAAMMQDAGLQVQATDASLEMVQMAFEKYRIKARCEGFDDLKDRNTFDGIWANFSLLHAPKSAFVRHLGQIYTALKPNGVFHIGTKLGTGEHRDELGRFYAYYSEEELADLLKMSGFAPAFYKSNGKAAGLAGTVDPFIILQSRKPYA